MTTRDLFALSKKKGYLYIAPKDCGGIPSLSVCLPSGRCAWTVNGRGMKRAEYRDRVSHELGHCERGAFYTRISAPTCRGKCEEMARRWQYEHMIGKEALDAAFRAGLKTTWELAEFFDLPEYLIIGAVHYFEEIRA